jgi:SpoVK/Ycf46/Vps4 family AAA+-type ATPase
MTETKSIESTNLNNMVNAGLIENQKLPIFTKKHPSIDINQVRLSEQTRRKFERILEEQEKSHLLKQRGLKPRYRILFHGAAGTGKTLGAEAIAYHLNKNLYIFNLESISGTNPDEAMKTVMDAFRFINKSSDIFLFDEFDAIANNRTSTAGSTERRTSNALLIAFEQVKSPAILICATNFINTVDPAFRRRFDTICKFELPSIDERITIIKMVLKKHDMVAPEDDIKEAAKGTEGLSYHEAEELANASIKTAVLNNTKIVNLIPEVPGALERRNTFKQSIDVDE